MPSITDTEEHWLARAAEARRVADLNEDPEIKNVMSDIAELYEHLAERARERAAASSGDSR